MTKTTTVPHLLEQLSVDLCSQGEKFDMAFSYGVRVNLKVRFEPVSERHDEPHVVLKDVTMADHRMLCGDVFSVEIDAGTTVLHLLSKSQVAAIEENLLAQMAGDN